MKYIILALALMIQACSTQQVHIEDHYIDCMDERTGHRFAFNTGEVTSLFGNVYGQGPFFVKDYKSEYMLIDWVATSLLTCSEEIIINRSV